MSAWISDSRKSPIMSSRLDMQPPSYGSIWTINDCKQAIHFYHRQNSASHVHDDALSYKSTQHSIDNDLTYLVSWLTSGEHSWFPKLRIISCDLVTNQSQVLKCCRGLRRLLGFRVLRASLFTYLSNRWQPPPASNLASMFWLPSNDETPCILPHQHWICETHTHSTTPLLCNPSLWAISSTFISLSSFRSINFRELSVMLFCCTSQHPWDPQCLHEEAFLHIYLQQECDFWSTN